MQTVITSNTIISNSFAWVAATESIPVKPPIITPNISPSTSIVTTVTSGTNIITVTQQPTFLYVGGTAYEQVLSNPSAGQYTYNPVSQQVSVVVPTTQNNNQIIIENTLVATTPIAQSGGIFSETTTPVFDEVSLDEIGSEFYAWLVSIGAGHSGELLLNYTHSKGDFPSLSIEIEITKTDAANTLQKLEDSINNRYVHRAYNTPFYLIPPSITSYDDRNIVSISLSFESIHAPRGEYNPLDYHVSISRGQQLTFTGLAADQNVAIQGGSSGSITARNDDKERRRVRDLLTINAQINASFIDYSGDTIRVIKNTAGTVHRLPDNFSILPEYTITKNGIIGAPVVDGIRLAQPWIFRGWLPDDGNLAIEDVISETSDDETPSMIELRWMGDPDLEPSSPTKILDGASYEYKSTEEADKFPLQAQNPSAIAYPNGFKKSSWQQKNEYGFNAGQIQGTEYGWQVVSTNVWIYEDPSGDFSEDPVWIYVPPVASAHWKKCRAWNLKVEFDNLGYPIVEQEIGVKYIQFKTETDNRTAATLEYEADKLEYEALQSREAGNIEEADKKDALAESKRKDAALYNFYEVPYTKTTRRFYRELSLDRPDIKKTKQQKPCNKTERDNEDPTEDTPHYLEREITEEKSLITIPNPYPGEENLTVGEDYESRTWTVVSPGGYQTFESTRSSQQSGNTSNLQSSEWRTGTPDPAPKYPSKSQQRRRRATPRKDKTPNRTISYLTNIGGDPVTYQNASRSTVTLEGVRQLGVALPALLEMCREDNLSSEQTVTDSPWYRTIKPGERALWMGKSWQCTGVSRRDKLHPGGTIQCQSYQCQWGSFLPSLALSTQNINECAV